MPVQHVRQVRGAWTGPFRFGILWLCLWWGAAYAAADARVSATGALAPGRTVAPTFDPVCVPWSEARYRAQKLFMTVELDVSARLLARLEPGRLLAVGDLPAILPGDRTLALEVVTRGPGRRRLRGELLLDAYTGAALQYSSLRDPSPRHRIYRFTETGPLRQTAKPLAAERGLAPAQWTDVESRLRAYAGGPVGEPVLEVTTLLYLLAASRLAASGDLLRVNGYATSADELYRVDAEVGEQVRLAVDYQVSGRGTQERRRSTVAALPIRVSGHSREPGADGAGFDILGLHDVEFVLDPVDRVIVAVRARMPTVGAVEFQLRELVRRGVPARCGTHGAQAAAG